MKRWAYYNENDPLTAAWLRWLIREGLIMDGEVDDRSIVDVRPEDVDGFIHCHWFAGIAGWAVAAEIAGFGLDRELWTGSCPCQPFSAAGRRLGRDDERHLWPDFHRLIDARRPSIVVGEQVSGAAGYDWFDGVAADLGGSGYACRAIDSPVAAVDSPQIRQRLWWVALAGRADEGSDGQRSPGLPDPARRGRSGDGDEGDRGGHLAGGDRPNQRRGSGEEGDAPHGPEGEVPGLGQRHGRRDGGDDAPRGGDRAVAGPDGEGRGRRSGSHQAGSLDDGREPSDADGDVVGPGRQHAPPVGSAPRGDPGQAHRGRTQLDTGRSVGRANGRDMGGPQVGGLAIGLEPDWLGGDAPRRRYAPGADVPNGSWWADHGWIVCHDGKRRRIPEPFIPLLAHGVSGRVAAWRGLGNAISPVLAAQVLAALLDVDCEP